MTENYTLVFNYSGGVPVCAGHGEEESMWTAVVVAFLLALGGGVVRFVRRRGTVRRSESARAGRGTDDGVPAPPLPLPGVGGRERGNSINRKCEVFVAAPACCRSYIRVRPLLQAQRLVERPGSSFD